MFKYNLKLAKPPQEKINLKKRKKKKKKKTSASGLPLS
jgi:hypothetical protein